METKNIAPTNQQKELGLRPANQWLRRWIEYSRVVLIVVAMAMHVHKFEGGASEGALDKADMYSCLAFVY